MRRVVVTGLGVVSPLGIGIDKNWEKLLAGESGIRWADHLDSSQLRTKVCGRIWDYEPGDYFDKKVTRRQDRFLQYALLASRLAVQDAQLDISPDKLNQDLAGVCIGSGIGGLATIEQECRRLIDNGASKLSPFFVPASIINMAAGLVSMEFGFKGPNFATVTACASGAHNIIHAANHIAGGDADVMLAGGAEYSSVMLGMGGFSAMRALSSETDDPTKASRPWDKDRNGFVLSDGAGVVLLESLEHATARGATILAELVGHGLSADAFHMTQPDPKGEGAQRCMEMALRKARLTPDQIGYINAHATSTPVGDQIEPVAIKACMGEHAYNIPISSTKSMTGHMLGAAGSCEAAFTIRALHNQIVPPTINCDNPDEGCDLDFVREGARHHSFDYALSNSFGFGGTNACLILKRWQG